MKHFTDDTIAWLLEGDVSIQFQVQRDLLAVTKPGLQRRIATEGFGAKLLAHQRDDGHWGNGYYSPKWTSTHYTLLLLRHLNISPRVPEVRRALDLIFEHEKQSDGGIGPKNKASISDVCVNGMMLNTATYFGVAESKLKSVVDFLLSQHMSDGGFNCRSNHGKPVHSSLHSTLSVLEGIHEYCLHAYRYRREELTMAAEASREFILMHRLYRSDKSGNIIKSAFLQFCFPPHWYYDVLRAMDYFQNANVKYDQRMDDALDLIQSKQNGDGRWTLARPHAGQVYFHMEKVGLASRWNTLRALRVLQHYCK